MEDLQIVELFFQRSRGSCFADGPKIWPFLRVPERILSIPEDSEKSPSDIWRPGTRSARRCQRLKILLIPHYRNLALSRFDYGERPAFAHAEDKLRRSAFRIRRHSRKMRAEAKP